MSNGISNTAFYPGLPGFNGIVTVQETSLGAAGNNSVAATGDSSFSGPAMNAVANSDDFDATGDFSTGGSGSLGGQDPPGTLAYFSGQGGSGATIGPPPPSCMTTSQVNEIVYYWLYYNQTACDACGRQSASSGFMSGFWSSGWHPG